MAELFLVHVEEWGITGVLLSLLIEGSALPFIGTFFITTVGFILELSWLDILWISIFGSFLYAVGSYFPYYLGYKLGEAVDSRLSKQKQAKIVQARETFQKYGIWSVAISSPLHLGNVVPFVAGISKMNLGTYTLLTMMGIAPSTLVLLSIGRLYDGDREQVIEQIVQYQYYILIGFVLLTFIYIIFKLNKTKKLRGS
ncbi:DedA family protein [Bacillus sp. 2205SS5-2]|uniref:DedA family protein n=1 Tax=Bacillus sp. 2205SS5-2 TaxID=3109031 RepID=UPI003007A577